MVLKLPVQGALYLIGKCQPTVAVYKTLSSDHPRDVARGPKLPQANFGLGSTCTEMLH